jgi:hypothetical protein
MLPGIEKVLAVYFDEQYAEVKVMMAHREKTGARIEAIQDVHVMERFNSYRESSTPISWYHQDDIPFKIVKKDQRQIEVFHELENTVLLLRIPNQTDQKSDLLFYYFNADTSNFGVSRDSRELTTELKSMISFMLYNSVSSQIKEHRENQETLKMLSQNMQHALQKNEELQSELNATLFRYRKSLSDLCVRYLHEVSEEFDIRFKLNQKALDILLNYQGDFTQIKKIIEQAAFFASTLAIGRHDEVIEITENHINTRLPESTELQQIVSEEHSIREQRFSTTRSILDDMETTAAQLKGNQVKLTSENLARALPKPKTASAITDQLHKHKDRIKKLFNEHPNNWAVIRKEFRPIRNIMNK